MKQFLAVLALTAVSVALVGRLVVAEGIAEPLVPSPERVVQSFVQALSAGRYEPARQQLSDDLQSRVGVGALRALDQGLQARYSGYQFEPGGQAEKQGERVIYRARIATAAGTSLQPAFALRRNPQTGLWEITSFDELAAQAQQ